MLCSCISNYHERDKDLKTDHSALGFYRQLDEYAVGHPV